MFRYFRLRVPQIKLILSFTLPLSLVFSAHVSASGFIDTGSFWTIFFASTAVMWSGLALYARSIDRRRQLPDVYMTYVAWGNSCISIRVNEKADILWQILQNDALFRIQTRMWWRVVGLVIKQAFIWTPAILLSAVCLMLWFSPETMTALMSQVRAGEATCLKYAAGNSLFAIYVATGGCLVLCDMLKVREEDFICFTQEYQRRVLEFALAQQKAGAAGSGDSAPVMANDRSGG